MRVSSSYPCHDSNAWASRSTAIGVGDSRPSTSPPGHTHLAFANWVGTADAKRAPPAYDIAGHDIAAHEAATHEAATHKAATREIARRNAIAHDTGRRDRVMRDTRNRVRVVRRPVGNRAMRDHRADKGAAEPKADPGSLLGARIAGARAILADAALQDDDKLLFCANAVHNKALSHPADADAQSASQALWRAEATAWADANGADPGLDEATRLQAYIDTWSLSCDPPDAPEFKDRRDIARRYIMERDRAGLSIAIADKPASTPVSMDALVSRYMDNPEVIVRYYRQFADYMESHQARYARLSTVIETAAVGLNPLRLYEKPRRMWHVKGASEMPAGAHELPSSTMISLRGRPLGDFDVVQMNNGEVFRIDAIGKIERLPRKMIDGAGRIDPLMVLRHAARASDRKNKAHRTTRNDTAHEYAGNFQTREPVRLGAHLAALREEAVRRSIAQWKEEKYLPSRIESTLKIIVPFYEIGHLMRWDPGYRPRFADIAWDASMLILTVAGVALTAFGGTLGVAASIGAARAAATQGVRAMIKAGMQNLVRRFSLRVAFVQGARELTDFVVPVFSVASILGGSVRAVPIARKAMRTAMRRTDSILRTASPRRLLDGIYEFIAHNGAPRRMTAEGIRAAMQTAAARPIPSLLYRGQSTPPSRNRLYAAMGDNLAPDDILACCIKHTAATGGSSGNVLSLSANRSVAMRFGTGRPEAQLFAIDTTRAPGKFRSIEDILLNDGPRLVREGKIQAGTLRSAIRNTLLEQEEEFFFVAGQIPDELIDSATPLKPQADIGIVVNLSSMPGA